MALDFAATCLLVRPGRPRIRFLSIGPRFCSTLPSDSASRRRPCALLALLRHPDGQRTFTSKLSNMLGAHAKRPGTGSGLLGSGQKASEAGRAASPLTFRFACAWMARAASHQATRCGAVRLCDFQVGGRLLAAAPVGLNVIRDL